MATPHAVRLWQWAGRRAKGPAFEKQLKRQLEAHYDTVEFVDAIHAASKILRYVLPVARTMAHLRHSIRGTKMPEEMDNVQMLSDWNTSDEFLTGAEAAHEALLEARWRPEEQPLHPLIREVTSQEVREYLDEARRGGELPPAPSGDSLNAETVEAGGSVGSDAGVKVIAVASRFEHLHGPPSLEMIRGMDMSTMMALRKDHSRLQAFHDDTWKGSTLLLRISSVAEVELSPVPELPERRPITLRRADRLHLSCGFNLREGIATAFRVDKLEALFEDSRPGPEGFQGEDPSEGAECVE